MQETSYNANLVAGFKPKSQISNNKAENSYQRGGGPNRGRGRGRWNNNNRPKCQICEKIGHTALKCYFRYNSNYSGNQGQNNNGNPSANVAQANQDTNNSQRISNQNEAATIDHIQDDSWYPDSGATNHITHNLDNLNLGCKEYKGNKSVSMGNGKKINISHIGNAYITGKKQLYLHNLLRVPKITKNLISVSQFANDNSVYFEFFPKACLVRDILTKDILLQGDLDHGLYKFNSAKGQNGTCDDMNQSMNCNLNETVKIVDNKDIFDL